MKYQQPSKLLATCLGVVLLFSQNASAYVQQVLDIVLVPYGNSGVESPAAFGVDYSGALPVTLPNTGCGSIVYIAPEDKQLFAVALSSQASGVHVNIKYEDNAVPL